MDCNAAFRFKTLLFNALAFICGMMLAGLGAEKHTFIIVALGVSLALIALRNIWTCVTGEMFKNMLNMPLNLHEDTQKLVLDTAQAMSNKLYHSQVKYNLNAWHSPPPSMDPEEWTASVGDGRYFMTQTHCMDALTHHLGKGDPIDCMNYLAFMYHYGWRTTSPMPAPSTIEPDQSIFDMDVLDGRTNKVSDTAHNT